MLDLVGILLCIDKDHEEEKFFFLHRIRIKGNDLVFERGDQK